MVSKKIRRLKRKLIQKIIPKKWTQSILRRAITLPSLEGQPYIFKIAETKDEQIQALKLLHDAYVRMGYMIPHDSGLRITPYHMLPKTVTPIAVLDNRVVATISVFPRTKFGLPIEAIANINILPEEDNIVEVSSLAVDKSLRGDQGQLMFPIMKFMYHCNITLMNADYEVIGVNPKMVPLYEALMLFEPLPLLQKSSDYAFVNGAPVTPLFYNLKTRIDSYSKAYSHLKDKQNLMKFFDTPLSDSFHLPQSLESFQTPQTHPEQFKYLFCELTNTLANASTKQKQYLKEAYSSTPQILKLIEEYL